MRVLSRDNGFAFGATGGGSAANNWLSVTGVTSVSAYTLAFKLRSIATGGAVIAGEASSVNMLIINSSSIRLRHSFSGGNSTWDFAYTPRVWGNYVICCGNTSATDVPVVFCNGIALTVTQSATGSGTALNTATSWTIGNNSAARDQPIGGPFQYFAIYSGKMASATAQAISYGASPLVYPANGLVYLPGDQPGSLREMFANRTITNYSLKKGTFY